jgi:hypothetical protein
MSLSITGRERISVTAFDVIIDTQSMPLLPVGWSFLKMVFGNLAGSTKYAISPM